MRYSFLTLTAAAVVLAGCQHPAPLEPLDPIVVEHEKSLNRAQVRDDSALLQEETIGGAAFREAEDSTQVLFNKHHEGQSDMMNALTYGLGHKTDGNNSTVGKKTGVKSSVGVTGKSGKKQSNAGKHKTAKKDKSIYAKDQSIYAKDKK